MEIKRFEDGTIIEQGKGRFDDWCVYLTRPGQRKYAPKDSDYFSFFIEKSQRYTSEKIYSDYVAIYEKTTKHIDNDIFDYIEEMSMFYDEEDRIDFCVWYSVIYLGMVAEERKEHAVLKNE